MLNFGCTRNFLSIILTQDIFLVTLTISRRKTKKLSFGENSTERCVSFLGLVGNDF